MTAPAPTPVGAHVIAGQLVDADGGDRIEVVNPADGSIVGSVPVGTGQTVDDAVGAARLAATSWSQVPVVQRGSVVTRLAALIAERRDELAALITAEMGSPITFSRKVQASLPSAVAASVGALADDYAWTEQIGNSLVVREPIGVVAAITPWNYPLHQVVAKVAPALLAGCTVVLKPSELTPLTANALSRLAEAAGVPAGVLNIVHGTGPGVGQALAAHPDVDMVSFTGSTVAGRQVAATAAATVKRVALELGGKSACVVLPDADLVRATKIGLANAWINGGQTCTAWTRMIVPAAREAEVLELLAQHASAYLVGPPMTDATRIGPMATSAQRQRVSGYLELGRAEGAEPAFVGEAPVESDGAYVQPTIFGGVHPTMRVAQEEIFGPVLVVMPYESVDEAVQIANSTIYGLAGAVFGSEDAAVEVARRMRTGQVDINGGAFNPLAPFGGYRQSGNGRELGRFGVDEFCEIKSIQR